MQFSMDSNMQFPLVDLTSIRETVFIQRGSMVSSLCDLELAQC